MPVDHKRINGPEISIPYQLFDKLNTKSLKTQFSEIVQPNGTRADGRTSTEHRKIFLKTGVVSQAKGSAYIELDQTKVIVSVFDPREIPNKTDYSSKGEIYCEFKFAPFSCHKRRLHQQDAEEQQFSAIMKQALESAVFRHEFPNFQVDIYAMVLHNDGAALSAAITAAGVALAHAGIPMYDLITSVTLAVQGNHLLVDPTLEEERLCQVPLFKEEENNHGIVVLSVLATHEQISQFYQSGYLSYACLSSGIEMLTNAAKDIVTLVKKCLVKHVIKSVRIVED
ncbi:exosome complex component MTR3 [Tribolium castaneum]|uniref:Exosome complex component MTR3-like Protein n=1 Tax=Tribolium castaneum TaxID=7070 RepID=D6WQR6_TRICA|nr:PREDICTED: exosome complex component MTR3 [Tribolium castaneum]EFA06035.2 Exosome complex component MTR3-like Protein [Tribolium castaneum]|eukprot:XP_975288.1 PREDICTED: exosome complex component MTR3 [Tribolium castaneum]